MTTNNNYSDFLGRAGLRRNDDSRVWSRGPAAGFDYTDGDEVEERIADAIASSRDVSLFSEELSDHRTDWASTYHLSPVRANLLRPLQPILEGRRVLEIGAGCGAISRYLGELGCELLALEGSQRRATIAASRCRDLDNVTVVNSRFDELPEGQRFDVVTLIGVLEYARKYSSGPDGIATTLRKARSLLGEGGLLIVAIENQLGLKYFAGMHEDHLGRAMEGIQDHYAADGVVTFGRRELSDRILAAGFSACEFALPFPDYKLPSNLILPAGWDGNAQFDSATLAGQATRSDRQLNHPLLFSTSQAFSVARRNGLLADLSNSFLVLAQATPESPGFARFAPGILAHHYAVERSPRYATATTIQQHSGSIEVCRRPLIENAPAASSSLIAHASRTEPYVLGRHWGDELDLILSRHGWKADDVAGWLRAWLDALREKNTVLGSIDRISLRTELPGSLIDAIPRNLIRTADGEWAFFDQEWELLHPISLGYLMFRAFNVSLASVTCVAEPAETELLHVPTLFRACLRQLGMVVTASDILDYLDFDAAFESEVRGKLARPLTLAQYEAYVLASTPDITSILHGTRTCLPAGVVETLARRKADLESAQHERESLQRRLEEVEHEAGRRDGELASCNSRLQEQALNLAEASSALITANATATALQQQLESVASDLESTRNSTSWRITRPLRTTKAFVHRALRTSVEGATTSTRKLYRRLPVSMRLKLAVKNALFGSFPLLFSRTNAYRRWKAHVATHGADVHAYAPVAHPQILEAPGPASALYVADGVTEWRDYGDVKRRIAEALHAREDRSPAAVGMLDFSGRDLEKIAGQLKLPAPVESPDVSIVIPAYNHAAHTLECLASIAECHDPSGPTIEIIVADDASTDASALVVSRVAGIRFVRQAENLGFLRNCNRAAAQASGKAILFLNNDVQVKQGWLKALWTCLGSDPRIGAVGPKIIYPSGWLQDAGTRLHQDGTAEMIGLNSLPDKAAYSYDRDVDYCSGACLLVRRDDFVALGGFDDQLAPAYCEDSDLCMQLRKRGRRIVFCAAAQVVHHLSVTSDSLPSDYKLSCITRNLGVFSEKWREELDAMQQVRTIAFYLPQFHPIPENDLWWGEGFTEWTNVTKARPNYVGHDQPRIPADLGYYDLRVPEVMSKQAELARRYGIGGFCFYYYWFAGHRLLERPIEQMLASGEPDFPFCLCWANENWTRRWDGQEQDVLMAQQHSDEDDLAVIEDLARYFRSPSYIRINGRPLLLVYRVTLFPDFARTSSLWRKYCRENRIGEIYLAQVESFELASAGIHPEDLGCDAAVEFPPQGMAEPRQPSGEIINQNFAGAVADYRDLAVRYATRELPAYKRFMGVMPGWDNTARRQNNSYSFEHSSPGAFQAWLETSVKRTRQQYSGDEQIVFINAWNEWAEGAYLEPDKRFGHSFLQAHLNALEAEHLVERKTSFPG